MAAEKQTQKQPQNPAAKNMPAKAKDQPGNLKQEKSEKSTIGLTVKKDENFSEWYTQLCSEQGAKLADIRYGVQGFIVHRPWAFRILRKIYSLFEDAVELDGHEPFLFPTVIPEKNLMIEKEHAGFAPNVFWVTHEGEKKLEEQLALRPTGETQIYPIYSLWIRSYNDLPFKGYQSRITTFRNEMTTRPFIRGREFMFFETHDVFAGHKDALDQVRKDMGFSKSVIYDRLRIPFIFFKRPVWDRFLGAEATYASDTIMPDGRRLQISSTHDLGQRFSKAYGIRFIDENGKEQHAWQTCYGPGIWRIMAAFIAIHGDDKGLVLPLELAPLQIVIVPIIFSDKPELNEKVLGRCREIEKEVSNLGYSVKIDDSKRSPGFKFNEWELMGVPLRIEIGPKEVDSDEATISRRTFKGKEKIKAKNLKKEIEKQAELLDNEIQQKADFYFKENTKEAKTLKEIVGIMSSHKGFVKAPFCSVDRDGERCADMLKSETGGCVICGENFEYPEKPKKEDKCIVCGKPAKHIIYVAKSY